MDLVQWGFLSIGVVLDCAIIYILMIVEHNGDVSLEN
jgi:hypothetical protein